MLFLCTPATRLLFSSAACHPRSIDSSIVGEGMLKEEPMFPAKVKVEDLRKDTLSVTRPSDVEVVGSPTEKVMLSWGVKLGMIFDAVTSKASIIHAFPFNSEKKRGGVAIKKGTAEIVLASCTQYLDDRAAALDDHKMEYYQKAIAEMAAHSLRCVAIAYRPYELEKIPSDEEQLTQWVLSEDELILLGIIGIKVILLESCDRLGGRINTDYSFGCPVDIGASWQVSLLVLLKIILYHSLE